ncbi:MAG: hypothetical protein KKC03_14215, partial [Bacteroidetes bacterium]|nr:hypothetical protein [Bacteroidota bacterium]
MADLPTPKRVLNNVNSIKDLEGRYEYMQHYVDAVPSEEDNSEKSWGSWLNNPEIPWNNREVQYYTHGLQELYDEMIHALINGLTGCLDEDTKIILYKAHQDPVLTSQTVDETYKEGKRIISLPSYNFRKGTVEMDQAVIIDSGKKQLFRIKTRGGRTVNASEDHLFFTKNGEAVTETKVNDLREGHRLVVKKNDSVVTDRIVNIKPVGIKQSYDLKVLKNQNFFLENGILTHNSGKTTLMASILRVYLDRGAHVLYRDDGKKEFRFLAYHFPHETRVWIPEEEQCTLELFGIPSEVEIARFSTAQDIIDKVYDFDKQLNVIVYDPFSRPGPEGWKMKSDFYSMLFEYLLLKCQGLRDSSKRHLIFNIDELNDLIPPLGKGTTGSSVRAAMEVDIRKLRGHNIQMFGSTHRFNQISIDTRSQMKNIFLKQSYGFDSYTFLSHNLISSSPKTFWGLIKKVSQMPENMYLLFDKNRNFDL